MNSSLNNDEVYKGEIIDMFHFFQKKKSEQPKSDSPNDNSQENIEVQIKALATQLDNLSQKISVNYLKEIRKSIIEVLTFALLLVGSVATTFVYFQNRFDTINDKIDECVTKEDFKELNGTVDKIYSWVNGDIDEPDKISAIERFNTIERDITAIEDDINKINKRLSISPIKASTSATVENLRYTTSMENTPNNTNSSLTPETYLGEDVSGNKYNFEDIIGQTVLLTYNEDGKEVYFLGQLNEECHWDGYCVTNVYNNDGTLYGICESNFDNGKRKNYKSFYMSKEKDSWIYTDKDCTEDGNIGISIQCELHNEKIKNFTNSNVRVYDILYVDDFRDSDNIVITSYYYGLTSSGEYNDETGKAYLIKYDENGYIRTFYKGRFVKGQFEDKNAWEIVFDSSNNINKYFLYEGAFSEGNRIDDVTPNNYITQEIINKIMQDNGYPNDLNWYITE